MHQHTTPVPSNIRRRLFEVDKTQRELAEFLLFSRSALSRRMSGRVAFRDVEIFRIAQFLDTDVAALLEEVS